VRIRAHRPASPIADISRRATRGAADWVYSATTLVPVVDVKGGPPAWWRCLTSLRSGGPRVSRQRAADAAWQVVAGPAGPGSRSPGRPRRQSTGRLSPVRLPVGGPVRRPRQGGPDRPVLAAPSLASSDRSAAGGAGAGRAGQGSSRPDELARVTGVPPGPNCVAFIDRALAPARAAVTGGPDPLHTSMAGSGLRHLVEERGPRDDKPVDRRSRARTQGRSVEEEGADDRRRIPARLRDRNGSAATPRSLSSASRGLGASRAPGRGWCRRPRLVGAPLTPGRSRSEAPDNRVCP
jgi:hypothetical protein